jgi:flagellar biosynthesis/type III secretory pathway chaperone
MDKQLASEYASLIGALEDETARAIHLLDVIGEETQALRQGRLNDVVAVCAQKEDAFRLLEAATYKRGEAAARVGALLGLSAPVSFTRLAACADVQTRQILTGYQEKLADVIGGVRTANEANRQVISLTLDFISGGIQFIRNISAPLPHYDSRGRIKTGDAHGALLSRAG